MEEIKKKVGRQSVELARQENKIRNLKYEQTKLKKSIEKLKEKLKIATEALEYYAKRQYLHFEEPDFQKSFFNYYDEENDCEVWIEGGKVAKEALEKIKEK